MKTLLSQFCEEFDTAVRPLVRPLTQTADTLNQLPDQVGIRAILPTVLDVRHNLTTLAEKVADQQAYVLIFGPLKSGKSTLMNAISATYVSEVTTLPAYPCMVFVSHHPTREFTITRYNGETQQFTDMDSMRTLMEWAHNELAQRLREVEGRGESFDPQVHMPQAIRRVDVRLPAEELEQSSAVLVDTPGLYARMKFGYDRLTKEFRNTASSAIFVVKTDNLFLEQVFDEFGELLKLFSRIFLVVNIDSTKRDLGAGGELVPSLEGEHPERIVSAFENLSMTAALKQARDEGRLRIYPVDLLQAASSRLQGDGAEAAGEDAPIGLAGFHSFLRDMSDYLNSTDYLVAFLGDSLRQAWGLVGELRELAEHEAVTNLGRQVEDTRTECERLAGVLSSIGRIEELDWSAYYGALGEDLSSIGGGRVEKLREQTTQGVAEALDRWFEGDGSFQDLLDDEMLPLLQRTRDDLAHTVSGILETVSATRTAGAQLPEAIQRDLDVVGLDLGRLGKRCMAELDPAAGLGDVTMDRATTALVPVRRGLLDYLLLRRQIALQRALFGPADRPTRSVPRALKERKLGARGRDAMEHVFGVIFDDYLNGALLHVSSHVLRLYIETLRKQIKAELRTIKERTSLARKDLDRRLAVLSEVGQALDEMHGVVASASGSLGELSNRYGKTDPQLLAQPVDEVDELLADGPPGESGRESDAGAGEHEPAGAGELRIEDEAADAGAGGFRPSAEDEDEPAAARPEHEAANDVDPRHGARAHEVAEDRRGTA